jgi:polyhydroxyalkanoate synthesis regulator phasin
MTDKFGSSVEDQVNRTLERMGVPSRQEIQDLSRKIDALTAKIDTLAAKPARGGSGPASPDPVPGQNR